METATTNIVCNASKPSTSNATFDELVKLIRENGRLLVPLSVRDLGDGKFELVEGFSRYFAAVECGIPTVPILILKE